MRKHFAALAGFTAVLAAGALAWGTLIASYPCPEGSRYPNGVAYRNNRLYIATNDVNYSVWQVRPNTGSVLASHQAPSRLIMGLAAGLAGETVSYWISSTYGTGRIYQVGYISGSVVNSFPAYGSHPMGLAFRNATTMYHTDFNARRLYVIHPVTGSIYDSYPLNFGPCDCAFGGGYLWIADGYGELIRQCDTTGSTLASFSTAEYGFCSGLGYYNRRVWVGINEPLHAILKFEVDPSYAVEPASVGRVKAIFR
jgi:hypothetical protein